MGKIDKLKARLCSKPKDFTYDELATLLKALGFEEHKGKGSARKFYNLQTKQALYLHEPHPSNILKSYIIRDVIALLGIC